MVEKWFVQTTTDSDLSTYYNELDLNTIKIAHVAMTMSPTSDKMPK